MLSYTKIQHQYHTVPKKVTTYPSRLIVRVEQATEVLLDKELRRRRRMEKNTKLDRSQHMRDKLDRPWDFAA